MSNKVLYYYSFTVHFRYNWSYIPQVTYSHTMCHSNTSHICGAINADRIIVLISIRHCLCQCPSGILANPLSRFTPSRTSSARSLLAGLSVWLSPRPVYWLLSSPSPRSHESAIRHCLRFVDGKISTGFSLAIATVKN